MNTGNPLASVQVEGTSGGWRDLARRCHGYSRDLPPVIAGSGGAYAEKTLLQTRRLPGQMLRRGAPAFPAPAGPVGWMTKTLSAPGPCPCLLRPAARTVYPGTPDSLPLEESLMGLIAWANR